MANALNSAANAFATGYDFADPREDKSGKTAYQRYVEKFYGPGVTSHRDPLAVARAATGAVASGLKSGAGFLAHAAAGLVGAPMGSSSQGGGQQRPTNTGGGIGSDTGAVSGITPSNRLYGNSAMTAGLSSPNNSGSGYGNANDIGSRISNDLQRDFGLSASQAAGIVGNLGHESGGFRHYQELNPIGGGRGGAGWAQWTNTPGSPRRTAFENYAQQHNLHPQSYEANYGFLKHELTGTHASALAAVKKTNTVKDAVYAFERKFERANPKYVNYASRMQYANNLGASSTASASDPQVAQLQQSLVAAGAKIPVDGIMGPLTRAAMAKYPDTASAYAPTSTTTSPAIQAVTAQASGRAPSTSGSSGNITNRGESVAAMQRDLNSRGAKLTVDGLEGPLTRQAAQQFYGSPTSVRTPSFTNPPATPANNWSSLQGSPTRTVNQRQDYVSTPGFTNRPTYTSGGQDEGRGLPRNPYTSSTGGANALQGVIGEYSGARRSVSPPAPLGSVPPPAPIVGRSPAAVSDAYSDYEARRAAAMSGVPITPRPVPTYSITPPMQWSQLQQPYPTSRLPQARPPQAPQARPVEEAVPTLIERLGNLVERAERVIGGNQGSDSRSGSNSGSSRSGGGSYSGGNYGGSGGSRISEGVGGAYRNR